MTGSFCSSAMQVVQARWPEIAFLVVWSPACDYLDLGFPE